MFNQKLEFMRKFTIIGLFLVLSAVVFAQTAPQGMKKSLMKTKFEREAGGKQISPLVTRYDIQDRSIEAFGDVFFSEDFGSGSDGVMPTGWTTADEEGNNGVWMWTDVGAVGPTSAGYEHILASTTAANGWMILDSDNYGSISYNATLTSPAYDFSTISSPQLVFEELYKRWGSEAANPFGGNPTFVEVSTDGNTWDQIEIHAGFETKDETGNPGIMKVNLTSYVANEPVVYIRFRMQGLWDYWWQIDDMSIVEAPQNDMVVSTPMAMYFYTNLSYNTMTPKYHAWNGRYFLGADILNQGASDQTNISLRGVVDNGLEVVYDFTQDTIGPWTQATNDTVFITDSSFWPDWGKMDYRAVLTVSADEVDQLPNDNSDTIYFSVSDTTWAHDLEQTGSIAPWSYDGTVDGDLIGCTYWMPADDTLGSISVFISDYTTPLTTIVKAEVWKYDSGLGDNILQIDGEEYIIQPEDLGTWITLELTDDDGFQRFATGNTEYYAMINCTWGSDTLLFGSDGSNSNMHNYPSESSLRIGSTWYYISYVPMVRLNMRRSVVEIDSLQAGILDFGNITCMGAGDGYATVNTIGGDGNYTYLWSNAATTQTITGLAAGTYTVTVTDGQTVPMTDVAEVTIMESATALTTSITGIDPTTVGGSEGSIDLTVTGGTAPYTYVWSNGVYTEDLASIGAGTYDVVVTDAYGCEVAETFTLSDPPCAIAIAFDATTDVLCNGGNTGSASITPSNGTAPYTFAWSSGETTEDAVALTAGYAIVVVSDAIGCSEDDSVMINEPNVISIASTITDVVTGNDGAVDITVTGGTGPYTFAWSNSATTEDVTGLVPATYVVTVTDANSCTASESFLLSDPGCDLVASISASADVSCNGLADGSATADQTGGLAPFTYAWSNGGTTASVSGLAAGTYTVTITDATSSCFDTESVVISEPTVLGATYTQTNLTCNGDATGAADLTVTGATSPYTYAWSNSAATEDISGVDAGTYGVTVTDANGCTETTSVTITEPQAIQANSQVTDATTCELSNGQIQMYVWGGTNPLTYSWSNSATTEDLTSLAHGNFILTVTDANGCTYVSDTIVVGPTDCGEAIGEVDAASLVKVYPNPTKGQISIENAEKSTITVFNVIGKVVAEVKNSSAIQTVDISGYPEGTYLIRVSNKDVLVTRRVILTK